MELVDMQDLGSCAVRRMGSSPTTRTSKADKFRKEFVGLTLCRD